MLHLVLYGTAAAHTLRPSLTCSPSASPVAVRMAHLRFVPVVAPSAPPPSACLALPRHLHVVVRHADAASQLHHATKNPRRRCRRPAPPSAPSPGRRSPTCGARDSGCAGATTAIPATPDGPRTTSWAGRQGAERPGGSTPGRRFREGVDERGKFPAPFLNGSYARCFAMFVLL